MSGPTRAQFKHSLDMLSATVRLMEKNTYRLEKQQERLDQMHKEMFEVVDVLLLRMKSFTKTQAELSARIWNLERKDFKEE